MSFAQPSGMAKNIGDLDGEHETNVTLTLAQTKEPCFGRFEVLLEIGEINRMGEVAGAEQRNALALRPPGEATGGGARVARLRGGASERRTKRP